jgi:hypothetical protein
MCGELQPLQSQTDDRMDRMKQRREQGADLDSKGHGKKQPQRNKETKQASKNKSKEQKQEQKQRTKAKNNKQRTSSYAVVSSPP